MMGMLAISYEVKEILRMVQEFDPEAVLTGGYLRDLDNDRLIKDVDIFVSNGFDLEGYMRKYPVINFDSVSVESAKPVKKQNKVATPFDEEIPF